MASLGAAATRRPNSSLIAGCVIASRSRRDWSSTNASFASAGRGCLRRRRHAGVALLARFRTDVLTLLVEVLLAEVLPVLGRDLAAFGRLLDRQGDATPVEIDVDDLDPQLLARCDDLLGRLDVVRGHLRDVHETFDAFAHLHEGAEGHELRDLAVHELADL